MSLVHLNNAGKEFQTFNAYLLVHIEQREKFDILPLKLPLKTTKRGNNKKEIKNGTKKEQTIFNYFGNYTNYRATSWHKH